MTPGAHADPRSSVNLPFLLLSAVLIGIGLTSLSAWMLDGLWWTLGLGIVTCTVGGFLLFQRGTGADAA